MGAIVVPHAHWQLVQSPVSYSVVRRVIGSPTAPNANPSSTAPSQSSSTPLQLSGEGVLGTHSGIAPSMQRTVTSQPSSPQVMGATSSSIRPSQSLSTPSHCSTSDVGEQGSSSSSDERAPQPRASARRRRGSLVSIRSLRA